MLSVRTLTWPLYLLSYLTPTRFFFQALILMEFGNYEEYLNNCTFEYKNLCDPFSYHNFYEKSLWENWLLGTVGTFWVYYVVGYLFFLYSYREKEAIHGYDADLVGKYASVPIRL